MKILEVNVDDIGMGGVFSLVRSVIMNKQAGATVDIAALEPFENPANEEALAEQGCTVHYVGRLGSKILKQFHIYRNVKRLAEDEGYDVVHIHADVANKLLVSALAARSAGCKKIIVHSHATDVDGNRRWLKKIFHCVCRPLLPLLCTDFLTCSDLAAKWMFPSVPKEKIVMVNNGINLEKFRFSDEMRVAIRAQLGLLEKFVVGHVGRFAYQKNHDFLIDIFKAAHDSCPNAVLLLVGEGDLMPEIKEKVDMLGLADSVVFYGVSHSVQDLFQAMDVFVLPSHFEGLPIVGVEAQSSGLPCLFSDRITREADVIGNSTFLPIGSEAVMQWRDKIVELQSFERKDVSEDMRKAGFSISDTVSTLWGIYQEKK